MIKKRYLVALSVFSAAIAACGSDTTGNDGAGAKSGAQPTGGTGATGGTSGGSAPTGGTGTGGSATGGTGTGGSTTGGTGGATGGTGGGGTGGDGGTGAVKCVSGVPSTSQVPRILNRQYDAALRDLLNVTAVGTDIPSANLVEDSEGPMTSYMWKAYLDVGSKVANAVMTGPNKAKFMNCDAAAAGCLETSIKDFGRKAFRRPMTDAEVTNFVQKLNAAMPAGTPDQVAETALWTFLVSPSFLLIPEMDATAMEGTAIKLSQYEVAARLSFLLWGSVPDQILSDAADQGMLATKDQILTQAQRMIAVREKTGPMVSNFHRVTWAKDNNTSTSHWWKMDHEANPKYVSSAKLDYRAELDKFFEEVAFSNGGFKDLFLSPVAFVNQNNAEIYGLAKADYGTDLVKVTLDAEQRPGFMTRAGFLSSFAHGTETAPILRGAFVTVNMIGVDPGPPMIDPSQIPALPGTFLTNREYVEALTTSQASCSGCHTPYVNPPGFTLENYDEVGAWQTMDPKGGAINAVADVTFSETVTKTISTPRQLMEEIGNTPFAKHMYAEQWVQFATGRYPNDNDACTVDQLDMKLSTDGYSVLALLADITQSDSFRLRVKATP